MPQGVEQLLKAALALSGEEQRRLITALAAAADERASCEIDLSPMTFDTIERDARRLAFEPPLTLTPTMDEESGRLYVLADDELGIDVFAPTREQLADEVAEQALFLWDAYAKESPERLTAKARQLRDALLARVREAELATRTESR